MPHGVHVELGCGYGWAMRGVSQLDYDSIGLDCDWASLQTAQVCLPGTPFILADAVKLPFADGSVDLVTTVSTFQYLDWTALLGECERVLRPGGKAIFVENLRDNPFVGLYRLLARLARRFPYGFLRPMSREAVPRKHISWSDRHVLAEAFPNATFHAYHVLTPAAFSLYTLQRTLKPSARTLTQTLYERLELVDRWLLRMAPALGRWSWIMVAAVAKPAS